MSARVLQWAMTRTDVTDPGELAVLLEMAAAADDNGWVDYHGTTYFIDVPWAHGLDEVVIDGERPN